jgi:methylenetetrahydrofolate reductase (NADPH)
MDDDGSMREAGIDYAAEQISALWREGARGIHIYTMNKPAETLEILKRCDLPGRCAPD